MTGEENMRIEHEELNGLLAAAGHSLASQDADARRSASMLLERFAQRTSHPDLGRLARLAILDLELANAREATARITDRSGEVRRLARMAAARGHGLRQRARDVPLDTIGGVLASSSDLIAAVRDLGDAVKGRGADLESSIERVLAEVETLRGLLTK
jgi:hypothetical protein